MCSIVEGYINFSGSRRTIELGYSKCSKLIDLNMRLALTSSLYPEMSRYLTPMEEVKLGFPVLQWGLHYVSFTMANARCIRRPDQLSWNASKSRLRCGLEMLQSKLCYMIFSLLYTQLMIRSVFKRSNSPCKMSTQKEVTKMGTRRS